MHVVFGPILPGFGNAEELPHPEIPDRVCLIKPNGMYVCVDRDGSVSERPEAHAFEAFFATPTAYIAEPDGYGPYVFVRIPK